MDAKELDTKEFGQYLKSLRNEKGLSLTQLGDLIGYSNPYLSQIENGRKGIPSPDTLRKLAGPLDVSHPELMVKAGHVKYEDWFSVKVGKRSNYDGLFLHEMLGYASREEMLRDQDAQKVEDDLRFLEHVTKKFRDLKRFFETDFRTDEELEKTQDIPIAPVYYNGHQLTEQDTERVKIMLKVLFPQYETKKE